MDIKKIIHTIKIRARRASDKGGKLISKVNKKQKGSFGLGPQKQGPKELRERNFFGFGRGLFGFCGRIFRFYGRAFRFGRRTFRLGRSSFFF